MNLAELYRAKEVITRVRDLFVRRVAEHPNAPAMVRDAYLDCVGALRTVERRIDTAIAEVRQHGGVA